MVASIEDIEQLEEIRRVSMLNGDVATLAFLLADQVVYIHANGDLDGKETYLAKLEAGVFDYREIAFGDRHIVVADDAAVVTGRMTAEVMVVGSMRHIEGRMTCVWHKKDSMWQVISLQNTPLAEI